MKKMITLLTAMLLLLSACSSATLDGAGKELEDTIANATDADNKYVQMVKGGYRTDNPDVTYEDAFTSFFGTPRWKYFEGEDGQDVVEFTGDCTYRDVPVKARIQFVVDEESGTFEATYLAFNEVPQDALTLAAVISKAFEGVEAGDGQGQSTDTTGQILIRQVPAQDVIGMTADEVIAAFGEPEIYAENDSIEYGTDAPEWMYFDVSKGNTVASFSANAGEFTLNGQSLKRDFDSLVSLVGNDYDSLGAGGYQWIRNGICYTFYIPDDTEEPYSINVYRIDDDDPIDNDAYLGDEGNYENYSNLDSALVGRWRSYTGKAITLDEYGYVTSSSWKLWDYLYETPTNVTWKAENGRLDFAAQFQFEYPSYEITTDSYGYEWLKIEGKGNYWREDTGTLSLEGVWQPGFSLGLQLQFYSDGAGLEGETHPFTWYDGDVLTLCPIQGRSYDYTISGDTLTLFFSDGADIFTKVGN